MLHSLLPGAPAFFNNVCRVNRREMFTSDDESKAFISDDMNLVVILDLAVGDPFTLKLLLHTDVIACLEVGNVNA